MRHPDEILPAIACLFKRFGVKRVQQDGKWFYRYKGELYPEYLLGGNAAEYILETAQQYCTGAGIDIGANQWPFPGARPIDDSDEQNALKLDAITDESLDYVFSSHCLEHIAQWQDALALWIGKLKPGGTLFLYLPHESNLLWRPGSPWVGGLHKWSPTLDVLIPHLEANGMTMVAHDPGPDEYWSFYICARRTAEAPSS